MVINVMWCFLSEQSVCGNIRLGFMVSKGQLEIDVIHVSGLQNGNESPPPG